MLPQAMTIRLMPVIGVAALQPPTSTWESLLFTSAVDFKKGSVNRKAPSSRSGHGQPYRATLSSHRKTGVVRVCVGADNARLVMAEPASGDNHWQWLLW